MRKSQPTNGHRLFGAGLATSVVTAVVLAAAPPALAALASNVAVTLSPPSGPVAGGNTVTATAQNLLTDVATSPTLQAEVRFVTATTCPTTLVSAAAGTNIAATSPTKINDDSMTFVVPGSLATAPTTYRVCIYGSTTTVANGAALIGSAATATSAYRTFVTGTLNPTTGPAGGGNQVTLSGTGVIGTATTVAATFTRGTGCPGTYTTGNNSFAATTTTKTSADLATITVPATATAAAGPYKVCVYNGATTASVLLSASGIGNTAGVNYAPSYPQAILSATTGKNGGGNTITATLAGAFANAATPGVYFTTAACPTTYPNSPGNLGVAGTATNDIATVTVPAGVLAPSNYNVCIYSGTTGGSSAQIAVGSATYGPSLPSITLSPDSGSDATATTITATSSTNDNFLLGVTTPKTVLVKGTPCPSTYPQTLNATNIAASSDIRISNNKMALTVPNTVVYNSSDGNTSPWNVCVYTGTTNTDTLVATAIYRVGATLTVTSISPTSGPAQGGSTITVVGGGFTAGLTATIGGAEIRNILVAANGNSFTGVTTPRGAGANLALTVKTDAGSKSLASAYSYTFGITVTPNTAPSGATVTLDVLGAGFESLAPFGTGNSNNTDAHVYLVRGGAGAATAYNPTDNAGVKTVPQIAECTNVLVISDLELLCTLDLSDSLTNAATPASAGAAVPEGTYTVTVVDSGAIAPTATIAKSLITSGSTFTVAPY